MVKISFLPQVESWLTIYSDTGIKLSEDGAVSSASEERVSECEEQRVEIARGRGGGVVNILRESVMNVTSFVKRQSSTKQAIVIAFAVLLLMQVIKKKTKVNAVFVCFLIYKLKIGVV